LAWPLLSVFQQSFMSRIAILSGPAGIGAWAPAPPDSEIATTPAAASKPIAKRLEIRIDAPL
jgi:hypothetical protein